MCVYMLVILTVIVCIAIVCLQCILLCNEIEGHMFGDEERVRSTSLVPKHTSFTLVQLANPMDEIIYFRVVELNFTYIQY